MNTTCEILDRYHKVVNLSDLNLSPAKPTSSSSQESEPEEVKTEIDNKPLYTEEEEQCLPMFQHEEKPPDSDMSSEDDKNFINDDESIDCSSNSESVEGSLKSSEESRYY